MSGHSKWSTIKRKKAAQDAKRGKIFTKLIKEITVAAREGGGDPEANPRLRLAIDNAKSANMPWENIERAIKKATGELEGTTFYDMVYEGYGPSGVAILVESLTDNKNRTAAEIRHLFNKYGGNLGENGSVAWMFEKKGVITVQKDGLTEDDLMELVLDKGAEDIQDEEEFFEVSTPVEQFEDVRRAIADQGLKIENASLQWIANNLIPVNGENAEKVMKLIEALEDSDEVQNVYSNADLQEEVSQE
jgi:YebC/PmpR family DNA-binding regulatory protein